MTSTERPDTGTATTPASAATATTADPSSTRQPSEIDALANQFVQDVLALNPELATAMGHTGHETEYGDYSPAGVQAKDDLNRRLLAELEKLTPQDEVDRVTVAALRERIGLEREIVATGRTELNLSLIHI